MRKYELKLIEPRIESKHESIDNNKISLMEGHKQPCGCGYRYIKLDITSDVEPVQEFFSCAMHESSSRRLNQIADRINTLTVDEIDLRNRLENGDTIKVDSERLSLARTKMLAILRREAQSLFTLEQISHELNFAEQELADAMQRLPKKTVVDLSPVLSQKRSREKSKVEDPKVDDLQVEDTRQDLSRLYLDSDDEDTLTKFKRLKLSPEISKTFIGTSEISTDPGKESKDATVKSMGSNTDEHSTSPNLKRASTTEGLNSNRKRPKLKSLAPESNNLVLTVWTDPISCISRSSKNLGVPI